METEILITKEVLKKEENISKLTTEEILKKIEELLIKNDKHLNEPKFKRFIKSIIRNNEDNYIEEIQGLIPKLALAWMDLMNCSDKPEILNFGMPPICDRDDSFPITHLDKIINNANLYNEEDIDYMDIYIEGPVKFKLIPKDTVSSFFGRWVHKKPTVVTNALALEKDEDRQPLYLDNNSRYEYLKECISYINEIKDMEIFKYIKELYNISEIRFEPGLRLMVSNVDIIQTLSCCSWLLGDVVGYLNYIMYLIKKELNIIEIGIRGEELVNSHLEMYDDEIINLSNIRLEVEGNSIENDNILLTPYGIYILEVKNLGSGGSYDLNISKDGKWSKVFKNGNVESIEYNATLQNERHIRYLQRYINQRLNRKFDDENYIKINGLVIIPNNEVDIKNDSEQAIFRMSEIYRNISKGEKIFNKDELINLKEIILKECLEPKKYKVNDYLYELKNNFEVLNTQSNFHKEKISEDLLEIVQEWFNYLLEIVERLMRLEENYNCNLRDMHECFGELDIVDIKRKIINLTTKNK